MATAALIVSLLALALSGWASVSYHRQAAANKRSADAAERTEEAARRSADAAERSATAAEQSATDAREVAKTERLRHHAERQPSLSLELSDRRPAERQPARLHSAGPIAYDRVEIWPDMNDAQTRRLVVGVSTTPTADEERVILPHLGIGQDVDLFIFRSDPELNGRARFIVTCHRDEEEWQSVMHVELPRPQRVIIA
jgi:hypothetical protein